MELRTIVSPTRGHLPPLRRQGSLYNLTLDEVQNQIGDLGKPLNSMNLDELLKSVIQMEENHILHNNNMPVGTSTIASCSSASLFPGGNPNLSRTLSRKTVDEVWREIVQQENDNVGGNGSLQRQPTLGEMTLEDFLVRAGAMNLANNQDMMMADPMVAAAATQQRGNWLQYHQMTMLGSGLAVAPPVFGNSGVDKGYSENQLELIMLATMVGAPLSDSQAVVAERKRQFTDEMMEKTIERRQQRMIKNRESAARSRARKQAYTNQLEHEVSLLRKSNWRLKKQKELMMLLASNQSLEPKYQLRRTRSAPV